MLLPGRIQSSTNAPESQIHAAGDTLNEERFEMTIDERIERLTERHEALAQSVEILRDTVHETSAAVERLVGRVDEVVVRVDAVIGRFDSLTGRFDGLTGMMGQLLGCTETSGDHTAALPLNRLAVSLNLEAWHLHSSSVYRFRALPAGSNL
jgi:hypothetical protein